MTFGPYLWFQMATPDWDKAVQYANDRARALGVRQKVKWRPLQKDWHVSGA